MRDALFINPIPQLISPHAPGYHIRKDLPFKSAVNISLIPALTPIDWIKEKLSFGLNRKSHAFEIRERIVPWFKITPFGVPEVPDV